MVETIKIAFVATVIGFVVALPFGDGRKQPLAN